MKSSICRTFFVRLTEILAVMTFFVLPGVCPENVSIAQSKPASGSGDQKIHVASDLLTTDNERGVAEFSGNVKVVQGETTIYSDRLKVFYKDGGRSEAAMGGPGSIEKVVATGNVKINFDEKTAVSDKAEYVIESQIVILSGKNTKVTTPEESVSGARITLFRGDGRVKVESGQGKRVEAIFYDAGQMGGN